MAQSTPNTASPRLDVTVIEPPGGWLSIDFRELWRCRELFGFLVWRDIKVRYKQTLLGFSWAIIGPLANTFIFAILFGRLGNLPTDGLPPAVFYMIGIVIWRYFSQALTMTSNSLVGNEALLTKIYVPRLILPTTPILTSLVDFLIAFSVLILVMFHFRTMPAMTIIFVPFLVLIAMGTALGTGLFFAALNVRYRDVRHILPFLTQLWMYVTIIIPFSRLPDRWGNWRYLYGLNPMGSVVEGFRWCLAHHAMALPEETQSTTPGALSGPPEALFPWILTGVSVGSMVIMMLVGLWTFKRMERQFADIV